MKIKKIYNKLKIELITYYKNRQGVNNSHFYHILLPSKWPILRSLALLTFIIKVKSLKLKNLNLSNPILIFCSLDTLNYKILEFDLIDLNNISVLIFVLLLFFVINFLNKIEDNLKLYQKSSTSTNTGTGTGRVNVSPEGEDKKPSGDGKPDPKGDGNSVIAGLLAFLNENKKEILLATLIGALVFTGVFFFLNYYINDVRPPFFFDFFRTNINTIPVAPITTEILNSNSLVEEAMRIARFQNEPIPGYFHQLLLTEANFVSGVGGFPTYTAYKEALLKNFLILYQGIDRNIVDITMLRPSILTNHTVNGVNLADIYNATLQLIPNTVSSEVIAVQTEIMENRFHEEIFLTSRSYLIPFIHELLKLLQQSIQAAQV